MHQLDKTIAFLNTLGNRDALYRLAQFTAQFTSANMSTLAPLFSDPKLAVARLAILKAQLGSSRKVFRMFKFLQFYKSLVTYWKTRKQQAGRTYDFAVDVVGAVSFFAYFVLDMVNWANTVKLTTSAHAADRVRLQNWFWLAGLLSKMFVTVRKIEQCQKTAPDNVEVLDKNHIDLAKNALDLCLPLAALKVGPFEPSTSQVGLIGILSSLIAVHQAWTK